MAVFGELFKSTTGILSLLTIVTVLVIGTVLFFWVKKQVAKDKH